MTKLSDTQSIILSAARERFAADGASVALSARPVDLSAAGARLLDGSAGGGAPAGELAAATVG